MIHATLKRTISNEYGTFGTLQITDRDIICRTLERLWLNNETDVSCIPAGTYYVTPWDSPTHGGCFKIWGIDGRVDILIHIGNWLRDTKGCILVGEEATDDMLLRSTKALNKLKELFEYDKDKAFKLTITDITEVL